MDAQATFSYSFTQSDVGGPAAQPPGRRSLGGPEAAAPGTAKSGYPSARWCSTCLRPGPGA